MVINWSTIGIWALRALPALIMLQTLFYKFSASDESVYIFSRLGMEPWGRIGSGVMELIAALLLLYPRTTFIGAALGLGLMAGAIFFHITKLGIPVLGDGGLLFAYALLTFVSCAVLLFIYKDAVTGSLKFLFGKNS